MLPVQAGNPFPAKGWGAFLTTGRTTDGGAAHGDQSSKEWRKERETERKSPQIIRNHAKKFYMPFRIRKVVGSIPIGSTKMEIAAVKTAAISRLNTEIPQTGFGFDHLKGTFFRKECPSLFTATQTLKQNNRHSHPTSASIWRIDMNVI